MLTILSAVIPTSSFPGMAESLDGVRGSRGVPLPVETPLLATAYATCERVTRRYSKSFYFATALLPTEKRRAIRVLYAFCRWSDDIVDVPDDDPRHSFETWVQDAHASQPPEDDLIQIAWHDVRRRFHLPLDVVAELLDGIRMDLTVTRYPTFDELWRYCYRVAATVGLLSMHITGFERGAAPYAIRLGIALQLTNILRDVGEDARRGRIYLPQDELARFGLCDADVLAAVVDGRWQAFMRFQIARAHRLYEEALPGIALLHPDSRIAVAAAASIYRAILPKIEANGYDTFSRRASISLARKLLMLPAIIRNVRDLDAAQR